MAQSFGPVWCLGIACDPLGVGVAHDGQLLQAPYGGDQRSKTREAHAELVLAAVEQTPDITIEELRGLLAEQDVTASHGAVWNLLARHGLTVKKKTVPASEQHRLDVRWPAREAVRPRSRQAGFSRRKRRQDQHGQAIWRIQEGEESDRVGPSRTLEILDLHRRPSS